MENDHNSIGTLIRLGANASATVGNETALHAASRNGNEESVKSLLALGANINRGVQGDSKRTPLYIASEEGRLNIVEILLEANASVDTRKPFEGRAYTVERTETGWSPIHAAAEKVVMAENGRRREKLLRLLSASLSCE